MIAEIDTPCGELYLAGDTYAVERVSWASIEGPAHKGELDWILSNIDAYFYRRVCSFPGGISFTNSKILWAREDSGSIPKDRFQHVLYLIAGIPYGTTRTYGDIAWSMGNVHLARFVGQVCKSNPLPVIIPCHRIVGRKDLGGYSAGIEKKRCLLSLEGLPVN